MEHLLGSTWPVFFGLTVIIIGFAAYMTGQAMAITWRPAWHLITYSIFLGIADRFLAFSLFEGDLTSPSGFIVNTLVLYAIAMFAFHLNRARKMVGQYPWLYKRAGLFSWQGRGLKD